MTTMLVVLHIAPLQSTNPSRHPWRSDEIWACSRRAFVTAMLSTAFNGRFCSSSCSRRSFAMWMLSTALMLLPKSPKQLFTCGAKCPSRTCINNHKLISGLQNFELESNLQRYSRLLCKRTLPVSLQAFFSRSLRVILALPYGTSCEIHDPAIFDTYPVKLIRLGLHNSRSKVDIAGHLAVSQLAHPSQNHNQHTVSLTLILLCKPYVSLICYSGFLLA